MLIKWVCYTSRCLYLKKLLQRHQVDEQHFAFSSQRIKICSQIFAACKNKICNSSAHLVRLMAPSPSDRSSHYTVKIWLKCSWCIRSASQKQKPSLCRSDLSLKRDLNTRTEAFDLSGKQEQKSEPSGTVAASVALSGAGEQVDTRTRAGHSFHSDFLSFSFLTWYSSSVPWACAPSLLCRLTLIHEYPPARLASPFLSYTLQVPCRLTGLMLASELPTNAFLGSTGEGKGWGEKLAPSLSFLTEQARNWAVKFGEPLFPVHCARFWTQTWMKFHWWLFFPAHLGTIWGQYNGIHHGFVSTAAPWTCSHPFY